ncbi:hypothetical protein [Eggerthella sinensis]|uniref:hypothetical protein n=1 Tax=Eggerthella sinensis TaxID=242230 RepID=UPI00266B45D8|nr:hypothetical protein [Eggerthella sinensis]
MQKVLIIALLLRWTAPTRGAGLMRLIIGLAALSVERRPRDFKGKAQTLVKSYLVLRSGRKSADLKIMMKVYDLH